MGRVAWVCLLVCVVLGGVATVAGGVAIAADMPQNLVAQPTAIDPAVDDSPDPSVSAQDRMQQVAAIYAKQAGITESEALRRLTIQAESNGLVLEAEKLLGSDYAGVWFDDQTGEVHVGYTNEANRAAVQSLIAQHVDPKDGSPVLEASSRGDLEAGQAAIDRDLKSRAFGIAYTAIDDRNNQVVLALGSNASDADRAWAADEQHEFADGRKAPAVASDFPVIPKELLATQRGSEADAPVRRVDVVVKHLSQSAVRTPSACVFPDCAKPLAGGAWIQTVGSAPHPSRCSDGFDGLWWNAALGRYDFFEITAGHCLVADENVNWAATYQPTGALQTIGKTNSYRWGGYGTPGVASTADIGTFARPPASFWYETSDAARLAMWGWPSAGWDYWRILSQDIAAQGRFGCRTGSSSNYTCGTVLAQSVSYPWGGDYPTTVSNEFVVSNATGIPGDSGGPFVDGSTALGTLTGDQTYNGTPVGVYAHVYDDYYWLGVRVYVPFS